MYNDSVFSDLEKAIFKNIIFDDKERKLKKKRNLVVIFKYIFKRNKE